MKTVIITGATSGIGLAVAHKLLSEGFRIIGVGRSADRCDKAVAGLKQKVGGEVEYFCADLMQQREINRLADELLCYLDANCNGELFALINNAGCVRSWYATTDEGYEQQFALNHLASFLLTYRLLPALEKANGRVIMTGSASHKWMRVHWTDPMFAKAYHPLMAYKQSKLCNILFAYGLNELESLRGVRAYVCDPGLVCTDIGCKQTGGLVDFVWKLRKRQGVQPSIPAATYAYLCSSEAQEGLYYYKCKRQRFSRQVTSENARRLFSLSERLCGVSYGGLSV